MTEVTPARRIRARAFTAGAATLVVTAALAGPALAGPGLPGPAAGGAAAGTYAQTTGVGVHNAYEKGKYGTFTEALDSGAALLELDVWTSDFGSGWRVSHSDPFGNDNNCENAATPPAAKASDQSFDGCLTDLRAWHEANPGHRPVTLKVELKDGFNTDSGRGPGELDALLAERLGDALFRPSDVVGEHATLDEAAQAGAWPERDAMAGKFLFQLIPGTVEESNPADDL